MRLKFPLWFVFISIGNVFAQQTGIMGQWEAVEKKEKVILQFNPDMTGSFDGVAFQYELDGKEIIATYDFGVIHYEHEMKNNQLIVTEGNLEHPYTFSRKTSSRVPVAATVNNTGRSSGNIDLRLLGTWSNSSTTVQFLANGTMLTADGKKHLYETSEGKLKLFASNSVAEAPYSFSNQMLNMVLNGQIVQMKKQDEKLSSSEQNAIKTVVPELSGKWCFISSASPEAEMSGECVILSKDGHYLFLHEHKATEPAYTERGEWWANASSLYFLSQNGQTDTFRITKKKHPSLGYLMLNIDGRNFISADKKDSWQ